MPPTKGEMKRRGGLLAGERRGDSGGPSGIRTLDRRIKKAAAPMLEAPPRRTTGRNGGETEGLHLSRSEQFPSAAQRTSPAPGSRTAGTQLPYRGSAPAIRGRDQNPMPIRRSSIRAPRPPDPMFGCKSNARRSLRSRRSWTSRPCGVCLRRARWGRYHRAAIKRRGPRRGPGIAPGFRRPVPRAGKRSSRRESTPPGLASCHATEAWPRSRLNTARRRNPRSLAQVKTPCGTAPVLCDSRWRFLHFSRWNPLDSWGGQLPAVPPARRPG